MNTTTRAAEHTSRASSDLSFTELADKLDEATLNTLNKDYPDTRQRLIFCNYCDGYLTGYLKGHPNRTRPGHQPECSRCTERALIADYVGDPTPCDTLYNTPKYRAWKILCTMEDHKHYQQEADRAFYEASNTLKQLPKEAAADFMEAHPKYQWNTQPVTGSCYQLLADNLTPEQLKAWNTSSSRLLNLQVTLTQISEHLDQLRASPPPALMELTPTWT